ncbi:hypothetical protein A2U01_0025032, partial [Trifolium medium]|nr:hypothetical protein [Trifolium medium]
HQRRFADKMIHYKSAINLIIASVNLSGNISKLHAYSSMSEFVVLKSFKIQMKFLKCSCYQGSSLASTYPELDEM